MEDASCDTHASALRCVTTVADTEEPKLDKLLVLAIATHFVLAGALESAFVRKSEQPCKDMLHTEAPTGVLHESARACAIALTISCPILETSNDPDDYMSQTLAHAIALTNADPFDHPSRSK